MAYLSIYIHVPFNLFNFMFAKIHIIHYGCSIHMIYIFTLFLCRFMWFIIAYMYILILYVAVTVYCGFSSCLIYFYCFCVIYIRSYCITICVTYLHCCVTEV